MNLKNLETINVPTTEVAIKFLDVLNAISNQVNMSASFGEASRNETIEKILLCHKCIDELELIKVDGKTSDGYHTFDELYEHRVELFIALCKKMQAFKYSGDQRNQFGDEKIVWRSKLHSDGTEFKGWFVLGIYKQCGDQITYHLPMYKWNECDFADTLSKAPDFDGHTSEEVLKRIKSL